MKRTLIVATGLLAATACAPTEELPDIVTPEGVSLTKALDVRAALVQLPRVEVSAVDQASLPGFLQGDLGSLSAGGKQVDRNSGEFVNALNRVAAPFRLSATALQHLETIHDELGSTHVKYAQVKDGRHVVGGGLTVHIDSGGRIYAVHGSANDGQAVATTPHISGARAQAAALLGSSDLTEPRGGEPKLVYLLTPDAKLSLAYEVEVQGSREKEPVRDLVYIDAQASTVLARHPQIYSAKNRLVYTAGGGSTLPGVLLRSEGGPPVADAVANTNYDILGVTYDCYWNLFGRDSFDNAGATLISSIHYLQNYVNAHWNGVQMYYGDGDGVAASNLANALDVTAHELTHAVTQRTAGLIYANESGGMNESMSDVFGNVCEEYRDGVVSANTWKVGEEVWTPATPGDALRYMNDPRRDGVSIDYYTDYIAGWTDVHYSSGLGNLAFYLASQGGNHPRGRSLVNVPAATILKARQIWYRGLTLYMSPNTNFAGARTALERAAKDLYTPTEVYSVSSAWLAVGVGGAVCDAAANAAEGTGGCTFRCVPITPLSGFNVCKNDCDCGNSQGGRYCYFGPFECRSTLLANPSPPPSQSLAFTGGAYTTVAASGANFNFATNGNRQVTVRTNWRFDYPTGSSSMGVHLRLVVDGAVVPGSDDLVQVRGGNLPYARTVTLASGGHSMSLQAASQLLGGPPTSVTLYVSPITVTLERQ